MQRFGKVCIIIYAFHLSADTLERSFSLMLLGQQAQEKKEIWSLVRQNDEDT